MRVTPALLAIVLVALVAEPGTAQQDTVIEAWREEPIESVGVDVRTPQLVDLKRRLAEIESRHNALIADIQSLRGEIASFEAKSPEQLEYEQLARQLEILQRQLSELQNY